MDLLCKDKNIKNKLNIKKNIDKKIFLDILILNNDLIKNSDYIKYYVYIQKRAFKNKKIYLHKKTKLNIMNLEEILLCKLFDYNKDEDELLNKIILEIPKLKKYTNIEENILNILNDLNVKKNIITLFKKKFKNDYMIKL